MGMSPYFAVNAALNASSEAEGVTAITWSPASSTIAATGTIGLLVFPDNQ